MANNQEGWFASSELNRMRKNPLFNRLRAQSTIDTGRYGNLQQDVINYNKMSLGREQLNKFSNAQKGLYIPGDNIGPAVNRRFGAAMGTSSEWAMPKLHDPFEWFRERCILPGEEVTLLDGPRKIEDVTFNDQALTHKGRYRRVLDIGNQEYEGKVYELKPRYRTSINVTADHPIWTQRDNENGGEFVHVQDLTTNDKILFPVDRRVEDKEFIDLTTVIDHSDLIIENGYFTRKLSEKRNASPKRPSRTGKVGTPISPLPVEIELTDDFLWFLGLYVAEGSTGGTENKTISLALSTKEIELTDKTISVLEKLTGKIAAVRNHTKYGDNSVSIELTNIALSRALPILCGKGSYNKHFPIWAMFLPEDKQKALLRGYFDGDGCYQPDITSCFTSSNQLRDQILQMMERNGFFPSVYHRTTKSFSKNTEGKNIVLSRTENDAFLHWLGIHQFDELDNDDTIVKRGRKYPVEHVKEGVWVPVEEIIESDYNGTIYSLTITEDHSYCVSGIATRNTWWFNMEDPDEQTRKIRDWARLIYTTHYLVPSMIDIYSRFPLLGMEFAHPDKRVNEFFSELFWDGLQYQDFLYSLSREHWLIGDVFALGSWNDGIGAWEADELINPNDVIVAKNRALRTYQYHIKVPEEVKKLVETRQPEKEYAMLMAMYPDVVEYARRDVEIPVSDVIMKGIPYKCLVAKTDILTPSGPRYVEDLKVGDPVIAWDINTDTPVTSYVEHNAVQNVSPVVTVTTKNGRSLTCTLDHPFLTPTGMVNAVDLLPGDKIRIGTSIDLKSKEVPIDLAYFLGLMVGDGSYYPHCFEFHNEEKILIDWVENFIKQYGCDLHKNSKSSFAIVNDGSNGETSYSTGSNNLQNLFRELGIFGQKSHQKRIPQLVWEGSEEVKWAFLSGYLDSDGHLVTHKGSTSHVVYHSYDWASSNQKLLDDIQLLLSVLGVPTTRSFHHIKVESYQGVDYLREQLTPLLPRKQLEKMWHQENVSSSLLEWDKVKEVKMAGEQETYALCIAGAHTHVSAGLVTKNTNPWAEHGTPILMRAFRQLMMEESLQASMEAISDRLYSPLILATLGLPNADQDGPWIPDAEELGALRDDLSMAINADFRLMVYHHGLQIQNAFGRESMPRLDQDFYRIQANYMMVFGIGSELLQGGKSGATYASGALNRELITQMLTTHQHQIKHFIQSRMRAVAERQGFYEYRNVGGHPVPIMETVLVVDEETGAQFIEERPKLAVPDIIFQSMSLQDENVERQFMQQLAGMGLPVSFQTFTRNAGIDFEDELETRKKEKVDLVIAEQQVKKDIFDRCFQLQLPIPMEYQSEYEAYIMQLQDPQLAAQIRPGAIQDLSSFTPTPNISGAPVHVDAGGIPDMYPSIANQETLDAQQKKHPPESHEQKKTQPKRSKAGKPNGPQKKTASIEDLQEGEILVTSRRTNENMIFEEGDILSNVGAEGGEWGNYRRSNPKQASVTEEFNGEKEITYGDRMKFSVPWESKYRAQMKLANGQKIVVDDNYEKYDELYMKDHIAKILESNVVGPEDDDFNDKLNEAIIPTPPTDFSHHSGDYMGFDNPATTGVNPEDMGPKVTFGSKEFPNRKRPKNIRDN
jgi:intein/homing endonuclease